MEQSTTTQNDKQWIIYHNPNEAYELLNSWSRIKTDYDVEFQGKGVFRVDIFFRNSRPEGANIRYRNEKVRGFQHINLYDKGILDTPDNKPRIYKNNTLDSKF